MGRRRLPGEGSIYRRADGRWVGTLEAGWDGQGRRRRYVYGRTKTETAEKMQRLRQQVGVLPTRRPPTVEEWLHSWLETTAARKVRPITLQGYRSKAETHLIPQLGRHRIDKLRPEHVEKAWTALSKSGLSSASILQCHRILSRALKVAMQRGHLATNPCALVDPPSLKRAEVQPYTRAQARAILEAAKGRRNAARWSVALSLGLRQGEALGLQWSDVDFAAGTLTVRRALQRVMHQGLVFVEPKSRSGNRTITLPPSLAGELKAHRAAQLEERIAASNVWTDLGLVFAQVTGKPIDPRRDWGEWREILAVAGVPVKRLHDARHTAATLLLLQGVDVRVASGILGHSTSALTRDTYQHVVPEIAADAAARMDDALWG